jgi:hypothetical protein
VAAAGLGIGAAGVGAVLLFFLLGEAGLLCGASAGHPAACMYASLALFVVVAASPFAGALGLILSAAALITVDPEPRRPSALWGVVLNGVLVALGAWYLLG